MLDYFLAATSQIISSTYHVLSRQPFGAETMVTFIILVLRIAFVHCRGLSDKYEMVVSERLGRTISKEQYAYFYK